MFFNLKNHLNSWFRKYFLCNLLAYKNPKFHACSKLGLFEIKFENIQNKLKIFMDVTDNGHVS